jgi:hypothetical protein
LKTIATGKAVVLVRESYEGFPRFRLDARGVDHDQLPASEALARNAVLVVTHEAAAASDETISFGLK